MNAKIKRALYSAIMTPLTVLMIIVVTLVLAFFYLPYKLLDLLFRFEDNKYRRLRKFGFRYRKGKSHILWSFKEVFLRYEGKKLYLGLNNKDFTDILLLKIGEEEDRRKLYGTLYKCWKSGAEAYFVYYQFLVRNMEEIRNVNKLEIDGTMQEFIDDFEAEADLVIPESILKKDVPIPALKLRIGKRKALGNKIITVVLAFFLLFIGIMVLIVCFLEPIYLLLLIPLLCLEGIIGGIIILPRRPFIEITEDYIHVSSASGNLFFGSRNIREICVDGKKIYITNGYKEVSLKEIPELMDGIGKFLEINKGIRLVKARTLNRKQVRELNEEAKRMTQEKVVNHELLFGTFGYFPTFHDDQISDCRFKEDSFIVTIDTLRSENPGRTRWFRKDESLKRISTKLIFEKVADFRFANSEDAFNQNGNYISSLDIFEANGRFEVGFSDVGISFACERIIVDSVEIMEDDE